jgi:NAD(P)H dehydrogenase (quinone)
MKILIITAHPSSQGFTHKIANVCLKTFTERGHDAEVINLYDQKWKQDFLNFENPKEMPSDTIKEEIQKKIIEAGNIVFIHPIWWAGAPAILKNFLDKNFTARFAFRYTPSGKVIGLLKGKTCQIFMTGGNTGFWAYIEKFAMRMWWQKAVLGLCGIKTIDFELLDSMYKRTEKEKEMFLELVSKKARKV